MTDDLKLSCALAKAIGWARTDITLMRGHCHVYGGHRFVNDGHGAWRIFDYRDPTVCWAVAEQYDLFPRRLGGKGEWVITGRGGSARFTMADTAARAVALAVIGTTAPSPSQQEASP